EEQVAVMRMLRGEHVFPVVRLEQRPWKSQKFGMQMRPHLQILDWRAPGGLSGSQFMPQSPSPQLPRPATTAAPVPGPAAPAPDPASAAPTPGPAAPAATATSSATAAPSTAPASMVLDHTKPVKPITLAELVADEIPWK